MLAQRIIDYIRGKAIDYATMKVERWYREEIDATPQAYKFLEKDVETVLDLVYEYHAQVMVAQNLLSAPLVENADYLSVCVRVPKRGEMEDLEELIREVQKMGEVSSELRTKARARVQRHIESAEADLDAARQQLDAEEAAGKDFDLIRYTGMAIGRVARARDRFRADKRLIERTGRDIEEQLAEALAILDNVKTLLRDSQDGFAVIIKECNLWKNNWNRWDYSRELEREAQ